MFCKVEKANRMILKKKVQFFPFFSLFGAISTHIYIEGRSKRIGHRGWSNGENDTSPQTLINVFVKPNEQNRACSSYAMARKRRMKSNLFIKPLNLLSL